MLNQLPSKWCVCPQNEENLSLIKKWACKFEDYRITFPDNTYTSNKTYITHLDIAINHGYTEITFDDFRKFILKEKSPEELLIEEAKIRYPIGTKFIPTMRGPGKSFETIKNLPFLTENGGFIKVRNGLK